MQVFKSLTAMFSLAPLWPYVLTACYTVEAPCNPWNYDDMVPLSFTCCAGHGVCKEGKGVYK